MSSLTKNCQSVTILKLGGSLLDLDDLPARLRSALAKLDSDRPLLVCGGGEAADTVRCWHETHGLDEEHSHWLAMESIRLNQRLLLTLMPELDLISNRAAADSAWARGRVPLLDLMSFISFEESQAERGAALPHTWDVTSDSLAAWVAIRWPASRFVLLKSVELPTQTTRGTIEALAELGLVDRHFPTLRSDLPATFWCNLRSDDEQELRPFVE